MPSFLQNTGFSAGGFDLLIGLVLYFFVFAFVGWIIEMAYLSTSGRGLINSGFLQGPACPAYAFGVLIIYPFTILFAPLPFWLQCILYAGVATTVEYMAHFTLEKILGIRIWDYSDEFLNVQGRISLKYSFYWFLLVLLLVLVLQPAAITLIELLPRGLRLGAAIVLTVFLVADYILSSLMFSAMSRRVTRLCEAFGLPGKEMHELQFNRPRIMNERKRVASLLSDPDYAALDASIAGKLLSEDRLDTLGFHIDDFRDILDPAPHRAWRNASAGSRALWLRHLRKAELTHAFCAALGLDARAAARGMLLAAYRQDTDRPVERLVDFLFPQRRVLRHVRRDLGSPGRIETDVMLRYTWPLNFGPPLTAECLIASFADKLVESREFRRVLAGIYATALARA